MKITFILPSLGLSGGIKVVLIYAQQLVKFGHTVILISRPRPKLTIFAKLKRLIEADRSSLGPEVNNFFPQTMSLDHRLIDRRRPVVDDDVPDGDIVVATWWETAEWVNTLSPSKGIKVYFIQGYEVFPYLPVERCHATYRMPLRKIVVANWLKNVMRDCYGDDCVVVVPNSVDHSQFFPVRRTKQQVPTVGILYSKTPTKGFDVALAVIREIRKSFPKIRVVCFGSERPDKPTFLEAYDVFYHHPPQDKIREIYSSCDAWLTASTSEGFNLPAMEAMACGTPVVSTRTGWPAEIYCPTS